MSLLVALLILIGGAAPVLLWARYRWSRLQPELFSAVELQTKTESDAAPAAPANQVDPETVTRLLNRAESLLEEENTPETTMAAKSIRRIAGAAPQTSAAIGSIIQESLNKAELTSLLLGSDDGMFTYFVVTPNRHDHAHLVGRYAPFAGGWRQHAELMRSSLAVGGDFRGMTSVLFFLSPEGRESVARIAFAGPDSMLIPSALAQTEDMNSARVKITDASFEFRLTAQDQ